MLVFDIKTGSSRFADFKTKSIIKLHGRPETLKLSDVVGISNDLRTVVGCYNEPEWSIKARQKRQEANPDDPQKSKQKVILRVETCYSSSSEVLKSLAEGTTVVHCDVSPNNTYFSVIYHSDSSCHLNCKIYKFTHGRLFFRRFRTFQLGSMPDETGYAFHTSYNTTGDLYLIARKQVDSDFLKDSIMVYDIKAKKLMHIPWNSKDTNNNWVLTFLIQTQKQNLVFVFEYNELLNVYEINRKKEQRVSHVMKISLSEDIGITDLIHSLHIHYFTHIQVYITTEDALYVICPIRKTILKTFKLNFEEVYDHKLSVNWSGEEIYLSNLMEPVDDEEKKYEVFVYYFSERRHDTLANLAKRSVLTNYTMAKLQSFKLPSSVKAMLGVL